MHAGTRVLLSLFCVCVCVFFNAVASKEPDPLVLGAGLPDGGAKDADGRNWLPDQKYLSGSNSNTAKASYQDPSLTSEVPYMSARIFTAPATYNFAVKSDSRYWLRLHFYPSAYGSLNPSDSYFSVLANGITLLNNFSASITCQALSQAYIAREFTLAPLNNDTLSLTFTPSDKHQGSFAFVNGIELIPIPQLFDSALMVGFLDQTMDASTVTMQTMFRLNVGGQYISPTNDSDLLRTWYDDTPYLFGAGTGVTNQAAKGVNINYQTLPQYSAPVDVYATSRSMGNSKDLNLGYNLTWNFQIDPNFLYLVRLHFCDYYYNKPNQIVFDIFVNNQTAQSGADVIGWTGGQAVPTYKDYVIQVKNGTGDDILWLALHPSTSSKPEFYDALLNGVEIFKVSEGNNLAGPNPQPAAMPDTSGQNTRTFNETSRTPRAMMIGASAGGAVGVFFVTVCIIAYRRKKRLPSDSHTSSWLPIYGTSHTTGTKSTISGKSNSSHISAMAQGLCRHFSLAEMKHATRNFEESQVIGVGGFGKVYKGIIDNGIKVAIKRSNPQSEQGVNEFQTEIEMLSKLRHKHLVSLIGFCEEGDEMCLVYDYMAHGTLREHLYKSNKPHLSWKQRLEICIGAARGLHYLHTGAKYTIIHRDVKTTNILLDENWIAKVSDFGLSKTGPDLNQGHVSTVVKGSFGYLDPEYFRRQQLTEKSDVYSFGVVLFEVLCARPALNPSLPKDQVSLADWALQNKRKGTLEDIIDPFLNGKIPPESLKKFADTAEKCLAEHGIERPSMNDLSWNLEFSLNLLEESSSSKNSAVHKGEGEGEFEEISLGNKNDIAMHYKNLSLGSDSELSQDTSEKSTAIFSQIVNPKGR